MYRNASSLGEVTRRFTGLAVVLACLTSVQLLHAQATATLSGTVTDTSGAAMSDATIQIKNTGTGISHSVSSDSQGRYRLAELGIGDYEVQATKPGFQTVIRPNINLTVGAQSVVDFSLPVGQAQQTVTVQAAVTQVDTESTAVGALVETKQIVDLPLNGRNFTQLLTLAPGVTQIPLGAAGAGSTFYGNGQKYSIAGSSTLASVNRPAVSSIWAQPSTQPGTVHARGLWRGTVSSPRAR